MSFLFFCSCSAVAAGAAQSPGDDEIIDDVHPVRGNEPPPQPPVQLAPPRRQDGKAAGRRADQQEPCNNNLAGGAGAEKRRVSEAQVVEEERCAQAQPKLVYRAAKDAHQDALAAAALGGKDGRPEVRDGGAFP